MTKFISKKTDRWKRYTSAVLFVSLAVLLAGCGKEKKEAKPVPKKAVTVDHGTANASKSGDGQSDAPFVIGTGKLAGNFNPFSVQEEADRQVVDLTQVQLVTFDRAEKPVYHGIDGEFHEYNGNSYTYYGAADLSVNYDEGRDETTYHIKLREDLVFSDREILNVDDVIFTLYALCDKSYHGREELKEMPVKGLLNYLADSTKAEKYPEKKVKKYIQKNPKKLQTWVLNNVIKKELERGLADCKQNYAAAGYETDLSYFAAKYRVSNPDGSLDEEELLKMAVKYYQKKGYQKLAQNAYAREDYFDGSVERQARIFMSKGEGKKVSSIAGIVRVNDFELEITTTGYSRKMTSALRIPVCPLHYYGDKTKYNYEKNRFGFKRGDISALQANKAMPVGAGAYRYVKLEDGVAYFTSNELYFLGCPKTAYVQVKDMSDILIETRQQIKQKQAQEQDLPEMQETDAEDAEATPAPTVNPSAEITELTQGTVDNIQGSFTGDEVQWITGVNSNEEVTGKTVESAFVSDGNYFYIGINGTNVSVGGEPLSDASKALRKAIATVFSAARAVLVMENGASVILPDYPVLSGTFTAPSIGDDGYEMAYNKDSLGEEIYDGEEEADQKMEKAKDAALSYLQEAGYTIEDSKAIGAPEGASLSYQLLLPGGEKSLCYAAVKKAVETLEGIGVTIEVRETYGETGLRKELSMGKQQLWLESVRETGVEIIERYGYDRADQIYGFSDEAFQENLEKLKGHLSVAERTGTYQLCYDEILENAVEVPMCEYCTAVLFSAARMVRSTIPKDLSRSYDFTREIQKIEMK